MDEPLVHVFRLSALGDRVLLIELGDDASAETALRVRLVGEDLMAKPLPGVVDVVPAVCSVALHYDPLALVTLDTAEQLGPYALLAQRVTERLTSLNPRSLPEARTLEIPVCYDGAFGEDLAALAQARALHVDEVIALHCAPLYRVQVLGFAPGFAYLAGLDQRLATPRRTTPRQRVPAGSVGIGGELTAVYPFELPGGWNLIGRSPVRLFDADRDPPSQLSIGDRVRFVPIDMPEYERLSKEHAWR